MVNKEQKINWQRTYWKVSKIRDSMCKSLLICLTQLRIKPNAVTYFGTVLMLLFILSIKKNLLLSLLFLLLTLFLDLIDGSLARFQKEESDKGKFIDTFQDITTFAMFVFGLVYANLLNNLIALVLIFTFIFSKIFRIIYALQHSKLKYIFKATAGSGFFPTLLIALLYIHFSLYVIFGLRSFTLTSFIFSILLFIDMIIFYLRIVSKQ